MILSNDNHGFPHFNSDFDSANNQMILETEKDEDPSALEDKAGWWKQLGKVS